MEFTFFRVRGCVRPCISVWFQSTQRSPAQSWQTWPVVKEPHVVVRQLFTWLGNQHVLLPWAKAPDCAYQAAKNKQGVEDLAQHRLAKDVPIAHRRHGHDQEVDTLPVCQMLRVGIGKKEVAVFSSYMDNNRHMNNALKMESVFPYRFNSVLISNSRLGKMVLSNGALHRSVTLVTCAT